MTIKNAFLLLLGIFLFNLFLTIFGGYGVAPWMDIPIHILGGFATAMFGVAIYTHVFSKSNRKGIPFWFPVLFILGFVMLIGVFWEFHEFILDQTAHVWVNYPIAQGGLVDTMKDLFDDWIGSILAILVFRKSIF